MASFDDIAADFALLGDWEERYRHLIELGRALAPLSPEEHNDGRKVRGCASQVWLVTERGEGRDPALAFRGDSDAHIVRGLIALLVALYSGRQASEILKIDAKRALARLDLESHLSAQRANGLQAMVARIREEAAKALAR
ncbi:MAG: SufE family protein [Alphaproteobacteria bacterium]